MTAHWRCDTCDRRGEGTWSEVDTSAARHCELEHHGTTTLTVGSVRVRDADGVRDVRGGGEG